MPAITRAEAVNRLTKAISEAEAYDVVEYYDELFPEKQISRKDADKRDVTPLLKEIMDHSKQGLEIEEIVALWRIVFTEDRNIYYDDETDRLCYNGKPNPMLIEELSDD